MYFLDTSNFSQFKPTKILSFKNHQKRSLFLYFGSLLLSYPLKHPNMREKNPYFLNIFNFGQFWPAEIDKKAIRPAGWLTGRPVEISNPVMDIIIILLFFWRMKDLILIHSEAENETVWTLQKSLLILLLSLGGQLLVPFRTETNSIQHYAL